MEAFADVTSAMRKGIPRAVSERDGKEGHASFSELHRREKIGLLNTAVDWHLYSQFGLKPDQAWRIIENAADGRPQDQWLEPVQPRHEPPERPNLDALLRRYAMTEHTIRTERNYEPER
jgi:hypothetical protein